MNFRLSVICLSAASVGLSIVIVSLSKLLLVLTGLVVVLRSITKPDPGPTTKVQRIPLSIMAVLIALLVMSLSLIWTTAPSIDALGSIAKYGKLLVIPVFFVLVQTSREAFIALAAFFISQTFLLLSSWMLFARLPVPWATSNMAITEFAVFSSYLDQGLMAALFAALCWHLRSFAPGKHGRTVVTVVAVIALGNVFFVLNGRSGHVVAIALVSVAIMWELPRRYRFSAVLTPIFLVLALISTPSKLRERMALAGHEFQSYEQGDQRQTSTGIRLGLWLNSIKIIQISPVLGTGVGSWSTEYNRLQLQANPKHQNVIGNWNPHQEYLLWGVQLGAVGIVMLVSLLAAVAADARSMRRAEARALTSAVLALAVASLFNSSLYDAFIGDFFCVVVGLLLALGKSYNIDTQRPESSGAVVK